MKLNFFKRNEKLILSFNPNGADGENMQNRFNNFKKTLVNKCCKDATSKI